MYKHKSSLPPADAKKAKIVCYNEYHKAGVTIIQQIKNEISESTNKQERIQLLTLAPEFWSCRDFMREFACTKREASKAKNLGAKSGIFSIPANKNGKQLSAETVISVKTFYEKGDVSRIMPGLKDYISVKQSNGKREHVQKILLLGNLNKLYSLYKKENEHVNIRFTKLTQLRPPHCVLDGSSGTHSVCMCVHHENVNLMLSAIYLENLTKDTRLTLKNYHDTFKQLCVV